MEQEIPKQTSITIIILLVIITFITLILIIIFKSGGVDNFKNSCESFGGSFFEIENVTCSVGHQNCRYMCSLNDEIFSMDELVNFGLYSYSKSICIKDCSYKNKQIGELQCVC